MANKLLRWMTLLAVAIPSGAAEASEPGVQRLRYEGTFGWFSEHPEDGETCTAKQPDWQTSGYLNVTRVTELDLTVHEEALGCTIEARSQDGRVFDANSVSCKWNSDVSVQDIGVVTRTFETWQYDAQTGKLAAAGRAVRKTAAGQRLVACFTLDLTVALPTASP